jgi:hypothetical protein
MLNDICMDAPPSQCFLPDHNLHAYTTQDEDIMKPRTFIQHTLLMLFLMVTALDYLSAQANAISFEQNIIDADKVAYTRAVGDLDQDGLNDIMAAPHTTSQDMYWFRAPDYNRQTLLNLNSSTHGYPYFRADELQLADVDRDGDLDAVTRIGDSGDINGKTVWIENPVVPSGNINNTWTVHNVGANYYTKDIAVADIDGDNKIDIVTRGHTNTQIWFQNTANDWDLREVNHDEREGMATGDLDGDGDVDIVLNGFWFETPSDPRNGTYIQHTIDAKWYTQDVGWEGNCCKVVVADVDDNGTMDVIFSQSEFVGYPVSWYSASDPINGPWTEHVIVSQCDDCHNLQAADFNLDGSLDVLLGGMPQSTMSGLYLYLGNGGISWVEHIIQQDGSYSAVIGDIGNDADFDVVSIRQWNETPTEIWRNNLNSQMLIPGDFDNDQDVDANDFSSFEACATGPGIPYDVSALPAECTLSPDTQDVLPADFDRDGDIDQADFAAFQNCFSGEGNTADPNCN